MEKKQNDVLIVSEPKGGEIVFESYVWSLAKRMWENTKEKKNLPKRLSAVYTENQMPAEASIYVERILSLLTFIAGNEAGHDNIVQKVNVSPSGMFNDYLDVVIPVEAVFPENCKTKNLEPLKCALMVMQSVVFCFENPKKGSTFFRNLIYNAEVDKNKVLFSVSPIIWQKLMDFSEGYMPSEYWVARQLSSARAYIMYKIVRNLGVETVFFIETLVQRLNLPIRDRKPCLLEKEILNPIRQQLDHSAPWSFEYTRIEEKIPLEKGQRGAARTSVKFLIKPVYHKENDRAINGALLACAKEERIYSIDMKVLCFLSQYGFTDDELSSISAIVVNCYETLGMADFFTNCYDPEFFKIWMKADNKKAYLVDAMKRWTQAAVQKKKRGQA